MYIDIVRVYFYSLFHLIDSPYYKKQQMEFNFEISIRGYHVYKSIWTYEKKIIQMTNLLWNSFEMMEIKNHFIKYKLLLSVPNQQHSVLKFPK
jgi:hypothetical protein